MDCPKLVFLMRRPLPIENLFHFVAGIVLGFFALLVYEVTHPAIFHWLDPWNLLMAEQIRRVLNLTLVRMSCLQPLPRSVGVSAYNLFRFVKLGLFGEKGASRAPISGSFCSQSRHGASGEHDGRAGGHRTLPHIERPCGLLDPPRFKVRRVRRGVMARQPPLHGKRTSALPALRRSRSSCLLRPRRYRPDSPREKVQHPFGCGCSLQPVTGPLRAPRPFGRGSRARAR